ncbi:MAG TPA: SGNH/GDSL hydrolase family protein, partial [Pyrinomonadaceae bacterium]|nr:SGNH/GDSL hydrolase family protein [Pyrinomonadaceae bacterium]
KLVLVLFGVLFGALIAEVALRVAGYSFPNFYVLDDARGYALLPGAEGWYRKEGRSYVRINSDGLRDVEHSIPKPANTLRIALIGDSYAEAFAVPLDQAFWYVMKNKLQECDAASGKTIEVINFGVSGYGTAQELLTLRERVWKYSPDVVMLAFTTNNDLTDNTRVLKKVDDIPYFTYNNDQLVLDNSFRKTSTFVSQRSPLRRFGRWLRNDSRVVQAIIQGHRALKALTASWRARLSQSNESAPHPASPDQPNAPGPGVELGADNLVYREPHDTLWNTAWQVTEELVKEIGNEVRQHGAKFVVVTLSNGPQVWPDAAQREAMKVRFGSNDLFYPDNRIRTLCQSQNIPVITLAPELAQYAEANHVYLHGFDKNLGNGHWNVTGNRVAGELIAKKICDAALLK